MTIIYDKGTPKLYYNFTIDGLKHNIDIETVLLKLLSHAKSGIRDYKDIILSVPQGFPRSQQELYSELATSVGFEVSALIGEMDGIGYAYRESASIARDMSFVVIDTTPLGLCVGAYKTEEHKVKHGKFVKTEQVNAQMLMDAKVEFFDGILSEVMAKNYKYVR